uniref:Uncharacterized protein n=1 Tax=Leersia perrieri TaxID=77586 RepID=A0A0D9X4W3_9ORYZ
MASPTLPLLRPAGARMSLRGTPVPGRGPQHNAVVLPERNNVAAVVRLPATAAAADTPMKGDGPKTNAVVVEMKLAGGAVKRPTPPGPREGSGGGGGVIHAVVADSSPEGAGGNGGAIVHAACAAIASS